MGKTGKIFGIVVAVLIIALILALSVGAIVGFKATSWDGVSLKSHAAGALYDYTYYKPFVKSRKAMILIPGLMASTFYHPETNEPMWGYGGIANIAATLLGKKTEEEQDEYFDFTVSTITADENNVPLFRERVGTMLDPDKYASFGGMKYIYDIVEPLYGDAYDVVVWQYDWRQHNAGSAAELEKFINYNGWNEVMFFTHSMGGVVTSNYLARSAENREKTKLFVPFGCPFFGSMDAITNLFSETNPSGMMNDIFAGINQMFKKNFALTDAARTLASVYELLPMPAYDDAWYYDSSDANYCGAESAIYYKGKSLSAEQAYETICDYEWVKRADGSLMPVLGNLEAYRSSLFVDDGKGGRVFVTELVPTEYIVGIGKSTNVSVVIDENGRILSKIKSRLGDGTVPAYSASAGRPLDDPHVHLVEGIDHGPLANDLYPDTKDKTGLKYLEGILAGYITDK